MRRTQIYLDEDQDARLKARAAGAGVTKSTVIRQAIDAFLDGPATDDVLLERFQAALDEVEQRPVSLPAGPRFVEDLRAADLSRQADLERRRG